MMMLDLAGKVALVTGAGSGIGRGTALMLAGAGARVAAVDMVTERVAELATTAAQQGYEMLGITADVSHPDEVNRAVQATLERWGALHVVVPNAGISTKVTVAEMDDATWDQMMAVNLDGVFYTTRAAIPALRASPAGSGRIVCVASDAGITGAEMMAHYSAAKAGIIGLVRSLALELAPDRITVNAIAPGPVLTAIGQRTPEHLAMRERSVPLGRIGQPEDIAGAILFLASDLAAWITGQVLQVNGGVGLG